MQNDLINKKPLNKFFNSRLHLLNEQNFQTIPNKIQPAKGMQQNWKITSVGVKRNTDKCKVNMYVLPLMREHYKQLLKNLLFFCIQGNSETKIVKCQIIFDSMGLKRLVLLLLITEMKKRLASTKIQLGYLHSL